MHSIKVMKHSRFFIENYIVSLLPKIQELRSQRKALEAFSQNTLVLLLNQHERILGSHSSIPFWRMPSQVRRFIEKVQPFNSKEILQRKFNFSIAKLRVNEKMT